MTDIEVAGRALSIRNTDKSFYPDVGLTKGDVIDYYRRVADTMVPHLRGRPLTLRRFPDGTDGNAYAQTFIAPYSLRARPGATAATPLDFAELGQTKPGDYDARGLPRRLAHKTDPWRVMHAHAASAERAHELLGRAPESR